MEAKLIEAELGSPLGLQWECLVEGSPASGFMQSLHWARFKATQNLKHMHVALLENDSICGGAIFYTAADNKGAGLLVAPDGPILPWHDAQRTSQGLRLIIEQVRRHTGNQRIIAIRIEPRISPPLPDALQEFGRAPVDLNPRETLFFNLQSDPETLMSGLKPKTRYNIKLAQRKGVSISEAVSAQDYKRFFEIMQETAARDNFSLEPSTFFQGLFETLLPSGNIKLFFAEHEGEVIGTLAMIIYGQRATYLYGGISNRKRNLMAGYALQWAAITSAQAANCTAYDFYGFEQFALPHHPYAKFSRFKRGFGGEVIRYIGGHDYYFTDALADAVIQAIREVSEIPPSLPKAST